MITGDPGMIRYDYGPMHGVASDLAQVGATAQGLLTTGQGHKAAMLATFSGDYSISTETCFAMFEQVCTDTIEITMRGSAMYLEAAESMALVEKQSIATLPF